MPRTILFIDNWPEFHPRGFFQDRFHEIPVCAEANGCAVTVVHHSAVDPEEWIAKPPGAILLSGSRLNIVDEPSEDPINGAPLVRFAAVTELLARLPSVPTLGICFGHQYLAKAAGGTLAKMATARDEPDFEIAFAERHPLLDGLPERPRFVESHGWRVERPGADFRTIATSPDGVEMVVHRTLPRIGVQFHPEYYPRQSPETRHGRRFLENWLRSLT
ncbi:MAG: gamma-glutamyl-gamma-aminobutyrate hydrolase family protein [Planctomycetes bacterium]|nr:gamma-glutamyl-gamma-aminobutyrate hydrolase family protein [Planctomycetota bacterium]